MVDTLGDRPDTLAAYSPAKGKFVSLLEIMKRFKVEQLLILNDMLIQLDSQHHIADDALLDQKFRDEWLPVFERAAEDCSRWELRASEASGRRLAR